MGLDLKFNKSKKGLIENKLEEVNSLELAVEENKFR